MSFWTQVIIMLATAIFIAKLYYIKELWYLLKHSLLVFYLAYFWDSVTGKLGSEIIIKSKNHY